MKTNLFINFYKDKNNNRQNELNCCLIKNLKNQSLDKLIIIVNQKDINYLSNIISNNNSESKTSIIIQNERPTYNCYFKLSTKYNNDINIIANSDIVIDKNSIEKLKKWDWKNYCLALTRWNYTNNLANEDAIVFYNQIDSQDCWMIKGAYKNIPEANFSLGTLGCDNKIAFLLSKHYDVINPSKTIKTYHYHLTNIRNYDRKTSPIIKPPYKLLTPQELP